MGLSVFHRFKFFLHICVFSLLYFVTRYIFYKVLKGHRQLMHMQIRYHFLADLHFTKHVRETKSEKRIRNTQNKPCTVGLVVTSPNRDKPHQSTHSLYTIENSPMDLSRKSQTSTNTSELSSTSNVNKYIFKKCKNITCQKSFLIRTSRIWNCLMDELDLSPSTLASFKSVIFNYYKSALAVSYDCEDRRSFKSVCLKCNSPRPLSRPITCCI